MSSLKSRGLTIVSIGNQKGGVGKTVSAITIASGLAAAGQKTLMIDGDPQGNLTLFYISKNQPDIMSLFQDILEQKAIDNLENYIIQGVRENLDLIPFLHNDFRSRDIEQKLPLIQVAFFNLLLKAKQSYDWILFDCSPSNGMLEQLIISSSEAVLVPLEFQLFSISGLEYLLEEIKLCGKNVSRNITVAALIFTKAENRLNRIQVYSDIFKTFTIPIYEICKSEYLPRSVEMRKTIWEFAPSSIVGKDYYKLIDKLFIG